MWEWRYFLRWFLDMTCSEPRSVSSGPVNCFQSPLMYSASKSAKASTTQIAMPLGNLFNPLTVSLIVNSRDDILEDLTDLLWNTSKIRLTLYLFKLGPGGPPADYISCHRLATNLNCAISAVKLWGLTAVIDCHRTIILSGYHFMGTWSCMSLTCSEISEGGT